MAIAYPPTLSEERQLWLLGHRRVVGVDEVGLGCLAGPIVSAAVIVPVDCLPIAGVRDSKMLSWSQRSQLFEQIQGQALAIGVGMASVAEVEQVNVLQASYLAIGRALSRVEPYDYALIDGRKIKPGHLREPYKTIVHGDAISYAIACASIVAKVRRDRLMQKLATRYPGYGWEKNVGYGTKQHLTGLDQLGVTRWHRRSYGPVKAKIEQMSLF